jgi:hypothetical protein
LALNSLAARADAVGRRGSRSRALYDEEAEGAKRLSWRNLKTIGRERHRLTGCWRLFETAVDNVDGERFFSLMNQFYLYANQEQLAYNRAQIEGSGPMHPGVFNPR